jgi:hypothetical protein
MPVHVTSATVFVGSAVVKELTLSWVLVTFMSRSDQSVPRPGDFFADDVARQDANIWGSTPKTVINFPPVTVDEHSSGRSRR